MPDIHKVPDRAVLVGVDGSAESLAALGYAATEAEAREAHLVVTHAWAGPQWRPGRTGGEPAARADAERLLATATAWLRLYHPRVPVIGRLVLGDPVQVLTVGSTVAQLVVVGHRGKGLHLLGWGSVAAQLSRRSKAPLVVRVFRPQAGEPPADAPVVVAVSPQSSGRTLRFAFEEAVRRGVPLAPCYVWSPVDTGRDQCRGGQGYADAVRALDETLAGWAARYPTVDTRPEVRHGQNVAQTLTVAARQARLLVVGAGPDNALVDMLRGSVSRGVLRTADCPVVVVPEPVVALAPEPVPVDPIAVEHAFFDVTVTDPVASEPVGAAGGRVRAGPVGSRPRT